MLPVLNFTWCYWWWRCPQLPLQIPGLTLTAWLQWALAEKLQAAVASRARVGRACRGRCEATGLGAHGWKEALRRVTKNTFFWLPWYFKGKCYTYSKKRDMKQLVQSFDHISWDKNRRGKYPWILQLIEQSQMPDLSVFDCETSCKLL